jgi:hypothetical protein
LLRIGKNLPGTGPKSIGLIGPQVTGSPVPACPDCNPVLPARVTRDGCGNIWKPINRIVIKFSVMALTSDQVLFLAILALGLVGLAAVMVIINPFGWFGKMK